MPGSCGLASALIRLYALQSGLDSLAAVELRSAVSAKFSLNLPATVVFDHPTPVALATFVAVQLAERHTPATAEHINPAGVGLATSGAQGHDSSIVAVVSVACRYPGNEAGGISAADDAYHLFYSACIISKLTWSRMPKSRF